MNVRTLLSRLLSKGTRHPSTKQKLIIIGVVAASMFVAAQAIIMISQSNTAKAPTTANNRICSDKVLQTAANAVDRNNIKALSETADKIMSTKEYKKDPNCMLVLTVYALSVSDAQKSQEYLTQLKQVYVASVGFRPQISRSVNMSVDILSQRVTDLERRATQYSKTTGNTLEPGAAR